MRLDLGTTPFPVMWGVGSIAGDPAINIVSTSRHDGDFTTCTDTAHGTLLREMFSYLFSPHQGYPHNSG